MIRMAFKDYSSSLLEKFPCQLVSYRTVQLTEFVNYITLFHLKLVPRTECSYFLWSAKIQLLGWLLDSIWIGYWVNGDIEANDCQSLRVITNNRQ